ncbi:hypothetical protein GV819_15875 [Pseudomonas sp. Fl5BN2]|uniref:hypothetical protein n=1 Tax=unclassified Pseudomonas TaxID=196821 RepID=UPI0013787FE6|nr:MULTISPECIES: hypothetical protein [unclassified Pseudomonas]MDF2397070.1 hypothetical protein [Pseudomonas sp. 3MA1]NBF03772.1 hypothetical protein [Pseudomonas sp. Fl5BN2]
MGDYILMLYAIKKEARTFQSDFYRRHAALVSEAASRGHISCISTSGKNMGYWSLTTAGQMFLADFGGAV